MARNKPKPNGIVLMQTIKAVKIKKGQTVGFNMLDVPLGTPVKEIEQMAQEAFKPPKAAPISEPPKEAMAETAGEPVEGVPPMEDEKAKIEVPEQVLPDNVNSDMIPDDSLIQEEPDIDPNDQEEWNQD